MSVMLFGVVLDDPPDKPTGVVIAGATVLACRTVTSLAMRIFARRRPERFHEGDD